MLETDTHTAQIQVLMSLKKFLFKIMIITIQDRTSKVGTEPLNRHNEDCRDLVDEAKDYLLLPEQRSKLSGSK